MTDEEQWRKWLAAPDSVTDSDWTLFRAQWKEKAELKILSASEGAIGETLWQLYSDAETARQTKQRQELETWARARVRAWERIKLDDYDFREWALDVKQPKGVLEAGTMYEFARESRKLRCFLAVLNPDRERNRWETCTSRDPETGEVTRDDLGMWFEDLDTQRAESALWGWTNAFSRLADELSENLPFSEVIKTRRDRLEAAVGDLESLSKVNDGMSHFLPFGGIGWGYQFMADRAACFETSFEDAERAKATDSKGEETILLRVSWKSFTDRELGEAMRSFAEENRPTGFNPPATHDGNKAARGWIRRLRGLSAMRLLAHHQQAEAEKHFEKKLGEMRRRFAGENPTQ